MFTTKITSQGTISLPAALRKKYGLMPGETVTVEDNGRITIYKTPSFAELRDKNAKYTDKKQSYSYQSGDGFTSHVKETYGKK